MKKSFFNVIAIGIALLLIAGLLIYNRQSFLPKKEITKAESVVATEPARFFKRSANISKIKGEIDIQNAFINVADKAGKAVVAISTERTQKVALQRPRIRFKRFGFGGPFNDEDPFEKFFEDFFGNFPEKEFKQKGLGSGFIIDEDGHILTNHHVVEGADKINVNLPDGRSFEATVKGADPRSDLAIVKINANNLPISELGDSSVTQVGEWVVALGNPFGHVIRSPEPTVTVGVVSALHRRIPTPGGGSGYLDMIQTDAAINPGNSGGPLCDLNGRVIGINVVIFSTSGGYQGVGFAIPINAVKDILGDLIKGKEIAYGWLGVSAQEITPDLQEYFNLPDRKGALISEIMPGSPAEKAGLKEGDIIRAFNDKKIDVLHDLLREVGNTKVGKIAYVDIIRDRVKSRIEVKIGKRSPKIELVEGEEIRVPNEADKWRGMQVSDITDEIARELKLKSSEGVVIMQIDPKSVSYEAGLREASVIREINKTKISSLDDYRKITSEAKGPALVRTDRGYFIVKEENE